MYMIYEIKWDKMIWQISYIWYIKLYDLVNNKGRDMMDPKIRTDAGMTQKQFDNALQNWDEYKRKWRDELPR